MLGPGVHRELLLPNPRMRDPPRPPRRVPFPSTGGDAAWLEVDWSAARGGFRYRLGSESASSLALAFAAFAESHAGARLGERMACPLSGELGPPDLLLRARAIARSHLWPLRLVPESDQAALLLPTVGALHEECRSLAIQLLFRSTGAWERGFLSPHAEHLTLDADAHGRRAIEDRAGEEPFHVELRVGAWTRSPESVVRALDPWLRSWRLQRGGSWRAWKAIRPRRSDAFLDAMSAHDLRRFAARKARRDISATELAALFPIPWKERHAGLRYAGAPMGGVPVGLRADGAAGAGPVIGRCGSDRVRLPRNWRHLLVLGRTRTGKSSLARSVALQLLRDEPTATVVVLEPTGSLIDGIRARLPLEVARDTIELDPARSSFHDGEEEMVSVPLNLIDHPRGGGDGAAGAHDAERRSEKLGGDLLQAIKNAWGEEAVGGRAEFILRGLVQGLSTVEGTNLVDAYSALSDKETLRRLERLAVGGSPRSALRVHLPRLDYAITISSLDKVGKVATNPLLRKTLCQRFAPVSFDRLLRHRLLLLNLAKGALGTEGAGFLGAVLLTKLWSAIQERQPGDPPVYLVVDEFHNYAVPAFADMLSEGARLGLHVVAVTQYLSRIPERVRSALLGNVDAWAMFGLGAEDQRDAWRIVQGSEFGWRPEDLVSGLSPFEAALYAERTLLKVATSAPEPTSREAAAVSEAVAESSRRYAQPEDSQTSPLAVPKEQLSALIGAIPEEGAASIEDLEVQLGWGVTSVRSAVALGA